MHNAILAVTLAIGGLSCLIYCRNLSHLVAVFFAKHFRDHYGAYATARGWDNPNSRRNQYFYRAMVLFFGCFLILMAVHALVGTIYL
jgi:hypothetical protein